MNNRQSYWEARLRAEGLAPIEFQTRGMIDSSADRHRKMTSDERDHWVDAEQLARIREIITEYRLPVSHRIILTAIVDGHPIRAAARYACVNKDKAHRIVLRYLSVGRATNAELYDLPLVVSTDPRRAVGRQMTKKDATREGERRGWSRPPAASEMTQAYFEHAKQFLSVATWIWLLDRDVWAAHANRTSRRAIGLTLGIPHQTVARSIHRTRKQLFEWLRQRADALPTKEDDDE